MGLFKILGFAALGVGAVAAAPFTGGGSILGAASLAGSLAGAEAIAAGAAVAGAAAAKFSDKKDADERAREIMYEKGISFKDGEKKGNISTKKLFIDGRTRKALFALAMYAANADNDISQEEKKAAMDTISKSFENEPDEVERYELFQLINYPPQTFDEVKDKYLKMLSEKDELKAADMLIANVVKADGHVDPNEEIILNEWKDYYTDRMRTQE